MASATGGFCGAHDLVPIAGAITAAGYAFMTPNVRTIGDPNGWTYARFEDCVLDVDAGVKYAKSRGFEDFILIGTASAEPVPCTTGFRSGSPRSGAGLHGIHRQLLWRGPVPVVGRKEG